MRIKKRGRNMIDILQKLQTTNHFSENEKNIATYMIENLEVIPELSSREFARRTCTTATSITRFVRKLGFKDYNEFKYNIVSSLKNMAVEDHAIVSNEDVLSLINKISQLEIDTIQKTKDLLSVKQFQEIMTHLAELKYIDIFANDTNTRIAQYASHCLTNVGKIANVYHETDQQLQLCLNATSDHIVIIVSKHARNDHLLNTAKLLKKRKIMTIAMTGEQDNELAKLCTYTLVVPFQKTSRMKELDFFIGIKFLFDLMYAILFSKNYEKNLKIESLYDKLFSEKL